MGLIHWPSVLGREDTSASKGEVMECPGGLRFTIVIATCNDAGLLPQTIEGAKALGDVQTIVVDSADSVDGTSVAGRRSGAKVLRVPGGRGRQMRAGVSSASGDVLVFVPPGARLPGNCLDEIRAEAANPRVLGGVFRARPAGNFALKIAHRVLSAFGIRPYRSPWFAWRTAVEGDDGFRPLRVFEDRELLARLSRRGKVARLKSVAILEDGHGLHRLLWTFLQIPYAMGVPARLLGRIYHKPRSPQRERVTTAIEVIIPQVSPTSA